MFTPVRRRQQRLELKRHRRLQGRSTPTRNAAVSTGSGKSQPGCVIRKRGMKRAAAGRGEEMGRGSCGGADAPALLVMLAGAELPVCGTDGGGEHLNSPSQAALPSLCPLPSCPPPQALLLQVPPSEDLRHPPPTPGTSKLRPPGPEPSQVFSGGLQTEQDCGADRVPTPKFYT